MCVCAWVHCRHLYNSSQAYKVLAASLAVQHARYAGWRAARLRAAAVANLARCNTGYPIYGRDLVSLVSHIAHPTSKALNADLVTVTDHTWVGPSAASEGVLRGPAAASAAMAAAAAAPAEPAGPAALAPPVPGMAQPMLGNGQVAGYGTLGVVQGGALAASGAQLQGEMVAAPKPYHPRHLKPCQVRPVNAAHSKARKQMQHQHKRT